MDLDVNNNSNQEVTTQTQDTQVQTTPDVTITNNGATMTATVKTSDEEATIEDIVNEDNKIETPTNEDNPQDPNSEIQTNINTQLQAENDVKADLQSKGIDFNALSTEFENNGELSKDSLAKLEKAGYPKSVVDAYINGMQATVEKFVNSVVDFAGGEENYKQLINFIGTQPKSTINDFNALIGTGNLGQIKLAIRGLQAEMSKTYGTNNPTIMARQTNGNNTVGYNSKDEMVKDMSDPRYGKDKAFTDEVYRKVEYAKF